MKGLVAGCENGLVEMITGVRRCGKSFLPDSCCKAIGKLCLFVVGDTLSDGVLVDDDCHSYEDIFFELHQVGVVQPDAAFAASCPY